MTYIVFTSAQLIQNLQYVGRLTKLKFVFMSFLYMIYGIRELRSFKPKMALKNWKGYNASLDCVTCLFEKAL